MVLFFVTIIHCSPQILLLFYVFYIFSIFFSFFLFFFALMVYDFRVKIYNIIKLNTVSRKTPGAVIRICAKHGIAGLPLNYNIE